MLTTLGFRRSEPNPDVLVTYRAFFLKHAAKLCFVFWVFVPLLRRVTEWHSSFHSVSVFSILPLLVIAPALFDARRVLMQTGTLFKNVLACVLVSYLYGFLISILNANLLPGMYDLCVALSPIGLLVYIYWINGDFIKAYDDFSRTIFWTAFAASLYGLYQFVVAPAWDISWLMSTDLTTFGLPEPFKLRVFGPTSAPWLFSELLVFALVINASKFRLENRHFMLATVPMWMALALSSVRTAWVQCALGFLVLFFLSPSRRQILTSLTTIILLLICLSGYLAVNVEGLDLTAASLSNRLQSLGDLSSDLSFEDRQNLLYMAWQDSTDNLSGQGLGSVGLAARLNDQGVVINFDNGYLTRFYETGLLGMIAYMAGLFSMLWQSVVLYAKSAIQPRQRSLIAIAIAVQAMELFAMTSADVYNQFTGIFFWMNVALISVYKFQGTVIGPREWKKTAC